MENKILFKTIAKITLLSLVLAMSLFQFHVLPAKAAALTDMSDTMSRLKISTSANHTIQFTLTTAIADDGSTITVTFPAGFDVASIVENDTDISGSVTGEMTTAADCTGAEEVGVSRSGQVVTFTICTGDNGDLASAEVVTIEIGDHATASGTGANQIKNPSSTGSKKISVGGTMSDSGSLAVAIADDDQVNVTATVDPSITFDLDTATFDTETATPYTVALGSLSTSSVIGSNGDDINSIWVNLATNADDGAVITALGTGGSGNNPGLYSTGAGKLISSTTGTISVGSEGYGICISDENAPSADSGSWVEAGSYSTYCYYTGAAEVGIVDDATAQEIINTNSTPISNGRVEILVKAGISSITPAAADYTDTITFIATGTF